MSLVFCDNRSIANNISFYVDKN